MLRRSIAGALVSVLLVSTCAYASLPDANVVKDRFELSGFAGQKIAVFESDVDNKDHDIRYDWYSVEMDYGMDDVSGIGFGYWKQTWIDDKLFEEDLLGLIALAMFGFGALPKYVDYIGDVHYRNQFSAETAGAFVNAAWVLGIGAVGGWNHLGEKMSFIMPEAGIALSKTFGMFAVRLNFVLGAPGGVEIGFKPIDNFEITLTNDALLNAKLIF